MIFCAFFISLETDGISGGCAGEDAIVSLFLTHLAAPGLALVGNVKKRGPGSPISSSDWEFGELSRTSRVKAKLLSSGWGVEGSTSLISGIFSVFDAFTGETKSGEPS